MHFARANFNAHIVQRFYARKGFRDVLCFQYDLAVHFITPYSEYLCFYYIPALHENREG